MMIFSRFSVAVPPGGNVEALADALRRHCFDVTLSIDTVHASLWWICLGEASLRKHVDAALGFQTGPRDIHVYTQYGEYERIDRTPPC